MVHRFKPWGCDRHAAILVCFVGDLESAESALELFCSEERSGGNLIAKDAAQFFADSDFFVARLLVNNFELVEIDQNAASAHAD